jgi:hypothetical protein
LSRLSSLEHHAKLEYIRSVLPVLNAMRRRTGTPHRIVVDEGHYFLHDAIGRGLLDLDFNVNTVVTYWPSQFPAELRGADGLLEKGNSPASCWAVVTYWRGRRDSNPRPPA